MAVQIVTPRCSYCGKHDSITLTDEQFNRYVGDAHIQESLSDLSNAERELLITGIHEDCWKVIGRKLLLLFIFGDDDDEGEEDGGANDERPF